MTIPTEVEALSGSNDDDERVGEAVELYLLATEQGQPPALDEFVARYPGIEEDIRAALEGLELVHGLIGMGSATGSGTGRRAGLDHRIESGRRIAGYRVVRELGRGGMGTVYEAVHVGLDRPVALKVLGVHAAPDSSARRRFLNEARTAAGLHHTHIVPVFDVGQVGGLCYYAMQRIEGSGLDRVLKHLRRTRQVASGVGEAISGSRLPSSLAPGRASGPQHTPRSSRLLGGLTASWRPGGNKANSSIAPASKTGPGRTDGSQLRALPEGSMAFLDSNARSGRWPEALEGVAGPLAVASAPLPGLSAAGPDRDRQAGEPPPFDPPRGPAYFRWAAKVALESADALAHAHHHGVIHRDVKPSNLLIDAKGSIWVTDFGLARRLADPGITHHDSLLGTPRYMSPEQARTGTIDGRTDVYSLGATLYELLTLRPPFNGQTAAELIDQIGQQEPLPPTKIDRRVPRDLETIALKALAKRPADRYASAAELFEDLGRFLNREPVKARRIGPIGRIWRTARRHPGITAVSTSAAAIILAIATFAYMNVVSERNVAFEARAKSVDAFDRLKELSAKERAANKENLRSAIELVGLSGAPNRRSQGLDLIGKAVSLDPEPQQRTEFKDLAVKFLVLREIEESKPELATGRSHGLVFTPGGDRLAVLSEDESELTVWDVTQRRQLSRWSLRGGPGNWSQPMTEPAAVEIASGNASDSAASGTTPASPGPRSGSVGQSGRPNLPGRPRQRLAQIGPYLATVLPDDKGLGLFDLLSGSPLRVLERPDHLILGALGESTGRRLITIEHVADPATQRFVAGALGPDFTPPREFYVYLWDADNLVQPLATLPWRVGPPVRRGDAFPLVAISPDGKTVAVASHRGMLVKLYSARDGAPLKRPIRFGPGQSRDSSVEKDFEIDPQAELTALALGPHNSLAMAGNTPGGVAIRIWNLDSPSSQTSLNPPAQSYTRMMRFSPQGKLLAIVGSGPIELWDPVALNLVAVLGMSDQATDVAFAPDGRTLAAVSRAGASTLWTIHDSAARTQLSGFDSPPMMLAWSDEGLLAGVGLSGEIWSWRSGRCPEIGPPSPVSPGSASVTSVAAVEPRRSEASGGALDQRTKNRSRDREGSRPSRRSPPPALAFDDSGRMVLHDLQALRVYSSGSNPAENQPAFRIPAPPAPGFGFGRIPETARTADGKMMALVRSTNIYLWHAQSPNQLVPIELRVRSAAEPPRNVARRQPQGPSEPQAPVFRSIQIAPGGRKLYTIEQAQGSASVLRLWEIDTTPGTDTARAREIESAPLPDGVINFVLGQGGRLLAVADRTGQVTLLDASKLVVVGRLKSLAKEPETFFPHSLAFSPDGTELAVGSERGAISLWSLSRPARPQLRLQLPGHQKRVNFLAYEPHGRRLASATFDAIVEVWDLDIIDRELARLKLAD
jgi:eukaryotic-like serine/threonine-protein kinase